MTPTSEYWAVKGALFSRTLTVWLIFIKHFVWARPWFWCSTGVMSTRVCHLQNTCFVLQGELTEGGLVSRPLVVSPEMHAMHRCFCVTSQALYDLITPQLFRYVPNLLSLNFALSSAVGLGLLCSSMFHAVLCLSLSCSWSWLEWNAPPLPFASLTFLTFHISPAACLLLKPHVPFYVLASSLCQFRKCASLILQW
jgi:hypothetical protein